MRAPASGLPGCGVRGEARDHVRLVIGGARSQACSHTLGGAQSRTFQSRPQPLVLCNMCRKAKQSEGLLSHCAARVRAHQALQGFGNTTLPWPCNACQPLARHHFLDTTLAVTSTGSLQPCLTSSSRSVVGNWEGNQSPACSSEGARLPRGANKPFPPKPAWV